MEFNLADLFEAVADAVPDRTALIAGDRRLTYRELDQRANRIAHYLRDVGVVPGQHVGIYAYNRAEWVESMFGCFKARVVPINVNYRYVVEELRYLFDNADLVALIFESEFGPHVASVLPGVPKVRHLIQLDDPTHTHTEGLGAVDYEEALASASPDRDGLGPRSSDDLYILYTGGTTGVPKGVMWRAEDIFFAALGGGNYGGPGIDKPEEIANNVAASPGVSMALAPLMHGNAQWTMFNSIFGGGTVVVSTDRRFDPDAARGAQQPTRTKSHCCQHGRCRRLADLVGDRRCPAGTLVVLERGAVFGPLVAGERGALLFETWAGDPAPVPADKAGYQALLRERGIERLAPPKIVRPPTAPGGRDRDPPTYG
jgi:acyl-CoA synthetase (AMP-forming)/AMP-acid ligase II